MAVSVLEIGLEEVKYKKQEDLYGITYGILKTEVRAIRYGSGRIEKFVDGKIADNEYEEALSDEKKCACGRSDALKFHGKREEHFVYGMVFGLYAIATTAAMKQTPDNGRFTRRLSENSKLFNDRAYSKCYGKKAKGKLVENEVWGLITRYAVIVGAVFYFYH